jgi:hypothetical protein
MYAFLGDNTPESRPDGWLLYEIHVAPKELCQVLAERFQPAEMVESAGRKARTGPKRQIDIGRTGRLASGTRSE